MWFLNKLYFLAWLLQFDCLKYLSNVITLLCYDQSQQRSGQANWPQNQKLINILACGLVFSCLLAFLLQGISIPEIFLVFTVVPVWL